MGYYHIKIPPGENNLCTIVLTLGKYEYQKIPMEVYNSRNIPQENISEIFKGLDMVRSYIDNVIVINKQEFKDHPN